MISPYSYNYFPYRQDDYPMTFRFFQDDPLDPLSVYDDVRLRIFRAGQEAWPWIEWVPGDGFTLIDENTLQGVLTPQQTEEMLNATWYYELTVSSESMRRTFVNGQINIFDVHSVTPRSPSVLNLTVSENPMILLDVQPGDPAPIPPEPSEFVGVSAGTFRKDGQIFTFNGTNAYYLPNYQKEPPGGPGDPAMVDRAFDAFEEAELNVIRMWAFYDGYDVPGSHSSIDPTENVIQTAPGVYDEQALADLDLVIAKGKDRGMLFILPFVNYWQQLGGISQYNFWAGHGASSWGSNRMQTFINGVQQQQWFRQYISMLLNRVNTVTGIAYKDEPAIMAWEIMNEARNPADGGSGLILRNWYQQIAQYIKSIDPHHLVGTGEEGFDENTPPEYSAEDYSNTYVLRANEGTSYLLNSAIPEIDFCRAHWYPQEFGMGSTVNEAMLLSQFAYINDRFLIAQNLGKPFFIGEYGLPTFQESSKQALYKPMWDQVENTGVAGSMIWQLTADHHKSWEFGGNINWPGGERHLSMFLDFLNHSKNQNGTPAAETPVVTNGFLQVDEVTNNDLFILSATATDPQFPQGVIYELYISLQDNLGSVNDILANGERVVRIVDEGIQGEVILHADNLAQDTLYFFNVLARNPSGLSTAYISSSVQTEFGDQVPPVLGDPDVMLIEELSTVFVLGYEEATDDETPQQDLVYECWVSDTSDPGSTVEQVMANGAHAGTVTGASQINTVQVQPNTLYFCRLLVFDGQRNGAVYNLVQVQTGPVHEFSIDTSHPVASDLVAYLHFSEGIGSAVRDIAEDVEALIEGESGQWDFQQGQKIWRKRNDHSEWITIAYRGNLSFAGGGATLGALVSFTHTDNGLYYIAYKGGNPGFHMGFPGWTNGLRIQLGNIVETVTDPVIEQIKNDGQLHLIILTVDNPSGTASLYIDGALIATIDLSGQGSSLQINWDVTLPIIDATPGYSVSYGKFALWTRPLTLQEILDWTNNIDLFVIDEGAIDTTPPDVSDPTLTVIEPSPTSLTVAFQKATDDTDPQEDLVYSVYTSLSDNLNTLGDILANGTHRSTLQDVDQMTAVSLSPETTYWINVIVSDTHGNQSIYQAVSDTTEPAQAPPDDPQIDTNHPMAADLVLYYQFHELEGTIIHDISNSPNTHDATTDGGTWGFLAGVPVWVRGTGQNVRITIPNHADLNFLPGTGFTIGLVLAYDLNNSAWNGMILKGVNPGWMIQMPGWNPSQIAVHIGSESKENFPGGVEGDLENLHSIVLVCEDVETEANLYVNGQFIDTIDLSGQQNSASNSESVFLPDPISNVDREFHYNKLAIWRRALAPQEVSDWHQDRDLMLEE